jgi:hypothetical protein
VQDEKKSRTIASLRGRIGAYTRWARTEDRVAATEPARRAFATRFEIEVDPDSVLPVAERHRRAEAARKAYFARLGLKSAQARAKKRRR